MTISAGELVLASDFNQLINNLNSVYAIGTGNSGYGASALPNVTGAIDNITSPQWTNLTNAIQLMGNHQGSVPTLPSVTNMEVEDLVAAFTNLSPAIDQVIANRLLVGSGSTTVSASILTSQRTTSWSVQIKHVFTVDFGSNDAARFFFNTGGQIRISMSAPNTVASHNWGGLYAAAGTFFFDHSEYYSLNSTLGVSTIFSTQSLGGGIYTGPYALGGMANTWVISARYIEGGTTNGARGSKIEISSISNDNYAGHPYYVGSPDVVSGTFTSTIGQRRSTTYFNRPQPVYATVTALTSGT